MELNKLIFPAPSPSYTSSSYSGLIWVPRSRYFSIKIYMKQLLSTSFSQIYSETHSNSQLDSLTAKSQTWIPCLYVPYPEGSDKVLLYFHGNAEDIGRAYDFIRRLSYGLKVNVLAVEYPGYGIYDGESNAKTIIEDAEIIFDFLTNEMLIQTANIYLFGRSIGSGPATYLAANRKPGLLILMSAYTSIRAVAKSIAGSWAQYLIAERFCNIDEIDKVICPCFFLHGKKDKLIPDSHATELFGKCKSIAALHLASNMTHNDYSMCNDILRPLKKFFSQIGHQVIPYYYDFPEYVRGEASQNNQENFSFKKSVTSVPQKKYCIRVLDRKPASPRYSKGRTMI